MEKNKLLKLNFKSSCNNFLDRYCLIKVISYLDNKKIDQYKSNIYNKFIFTNILMYNLKYNPDIIPIIKKYQTKVDIISFFGETWLDHDERSICMFEINMNIYILIYNEGTEFIELWAMSESKDKKDFIKVKNLIKATVVFKNIYNTILSKIIVSHHYANQSNYICISCVNDVNITSSLYKIKLLSKTVTMQSVGSLKKYKINKEFNFTFTYQPKITNLFSLKSNKSISFHLSINYVNSDLYFIDLTSKSSQTKLKKFDVGFNTYVNYNFLIYINNVIHLVIFAKYVIVVYNIKDEANYKIFGDYRTNYINGRLSNNKLYCVSKCGTGTNNNKSNSFTQIYDWESQKLIKTIKGLFRLDYFSIFINWKSNLTSKGFRHSYLLVCDNSLNNEIRVYDANKDEFIWIINSVKRINNDTDTIVHNFEDEDNNSNNSAMGDNDGEILYMYQSKDLRSLYIIYCESRILQNYKVKKVDFLS